MSTVMAEDNWYTDCERGLMRGWIDSHWPGRQKFPSPAGTGSFLQEDFLFLSTNWIALPSLPHFRFRQPNLLLGSATNGSRICQSLGDFRCMTILVTEVFPQSSQACCHTWCPVTHLQIFLKKMRNVSVTYGKPSSPIICLITSKQPSAEGIGRTMIVIVSWMFFWKYLIFFKFQTSTASDRI